MTEDDARAKSQAGPEQRVVCGCSTPRGIRVGIHCNGNQGLARQVEDALQVVGLGKKIYQVNLLDAVSGLE